MRLHKIHERMRVKFTEPHKHMVLLTSHDLSCGESDEDVSQVVMKNGVAGDDGETE